MTVQITPKSTQHTGMATSTEGSVAAWEVTFELNENESLHAAIDIRLAGTPTHQEARQKALKILQVFLNDACAAAKKINFQIKTLPTPRRRIKPVHGLWLIDRETITTQRRGDGMK